MTRSGSLIYSLHMQNKLLKTINFILRWGELAQQITTDKYQD